jgi:hypothetical protein
MRGRGDFSSRGDGRGGGGFGGRGKLQIFYGMICRGRSQNITCKILSYISLSVCSMFRLW